MNKTLVFDMDGTIANFYGVDGWLNDLKNENVRPYVECEPLYDMDTLNVILETFKIVGYRIVVTTWLSMDSTEEFKRATRKAKLDWLEKYGFPYDEIHLVQYGTTKANCTRKLGGYQILIDDNEQVRKGWTLGETINAKENIIEQLMKILEKEWN